MKLFKKRKVIYRDGEKPYLIRWNIFECKLFSIKVHRILRSDPDCMHDHPWPFVSLILRGGYVEHRDLTKRTAGGQELVYQSTTRIYHPGSILYRRATDRHKLEVHQPATTLVLTFKKVRQWGFWTKAGWVPFFNYSPEDQCN